MGTVTEVLVKPVPTLLIGVVGGLIVGMTSVGAGSLIIVLMMFLYPVLAANQLVGTDLVQAIPLTAAAALGVLVFGHLEIPLTLSIIVGSVPAVFLGSLISSRVSDKILRPMITFVIFASGLKYVGMKTQTLGWTLVAVLAAALLGWLTFTKPWRQLSAAPVTVADPPVSPAAQHGVAYHRVPGSRTGQFESTATSIRDVRFVEGSAEVGETG
jgi:uncharacterized protein